MNTDIFPKFLLQKYKSLHAQAAHPLISGLDHLTSPEVLRLPQSVFDRAREVIKIIFEASNDPKFLDLVREQLSVHDRSLLYPTRKQNSILMAYDFHYSDGNLKLIEINTNASGFLISSELYACHGQENIAADSKMKLRSSIENEIKLFNVDSKKVANQNQNQKVAITDVGIQTQKMYSEFLMYQELFQSWGLDTHLVETADLEPQDYNFVYNRSTDFTFSQPQAAKMLMAYNNFETCFSPHPQEYLKLSSKTNLPILKNVTGLPEILESFAIQSKDPLELWAQRKKYFFKPANLFGAKAAYNGASITKTTFQNAIDQNFIAQEFAPPGRFGEWKYDLRFYVYQNEIHLCAARLYQGQVTNMSKLGGGLTRILFK
jgi:hypothetical protein